MLNLTKYTKFTIKAFFNPIIIISAFGPSLANSASISYISSNSFYQYINRPFLGVLDFQIQAYTVVLGYTIAFLLFSKVILFKTSHKTLVTIINEISSKPTNLMFYILSLLVFTTGFIVIALL